MTALLYLDHQDLNQADATITSCTTSQDITEIELNQTIFYPQGGGQQCDQGTITGPNGEIFVESVKKDNEKIIHKGKILNGSFKIGDTVVLKIDGERRLLNSRLQTAGHVIDACLFNLGITGLVPSKGYHFPDGPYDEYIGEAKNPDILKKEIEKQANLLIQENRKILIRYVDPKDVEKECGYAPSFIPPTGKVRLVQIYGFPPIPCGGTHVQALGELGKMEIRKISTKKGLTKIAYQLAKDTDLR